MSKHPACDSCENGFVLKQGWRSSNICKVAAGEIPENSIRFLKKVGCISYIKNVEEMVKMDERTKKFLTHYLGLTRLLLNSDCLREERQQDISYALDVMNYFADENLGIDFDSAEIRAMGITKV